MRKEIYGNNSVFSPSGKLMFKCKEKKINWYLSRDLAVRLSPDSIKLTFQPAGEGNHDDPFSVNDNFNRCVKCGSAHDLTRHHVVPRSFRSFFPDELKNHNFHDVVVLCEECHREYENHASRLKKIISIVYNVPFVFNSRDDKSIKRYIAKKRAYALIHHPNSIPADRKIEIKKEIGELLGIAIDFEITEDFLNSIFFERKKGSYEFVYAKEVMLKITNYQKFTEIWRQHFIYYAQPRFLNQFWDVKRPLTLENRKCKIKSK